MTHQQINARLIRFIKEHHGHKSAAQALGISQGYLSDILSGRRAIPDSVLTAIGIVRLISYKRVKLT